MIRPKKVRPRIIQPTDVIGWADASVWRFVRRMLRSFLIGWADDSVLYDKASAVSSCQTNLIGRAARLVSYWLTRLIGPSDLLVLLRMLLIGCFADELLASSMGFLATRCQTCKHADEKTITRKRLLCGGEYATIRRSDLSLTPKQIKQTSPCVTYPTRWWSIYTVHYALLWRSVSVLVVVV